eukprot:Protomagalhaensia_sp_Gyna_25__4319@NODE_394_length_3589_cov_22_704789_g303_i0_p1_GENE_NODE_394_length_3589_cov_22_704789_g303_i0NODE_394_length_3589_cov_22_704789_g303_i0_p1_ORF_typecomplete_len417_score43_98Arrestin_N/PF00339_29/3_4e08Arrestin_N/PF00339_29/4_8e03Arrestin_C/PF02752_22/27Arrestin_C/PF02752_22/0_49_NODE_394_length_3589_cov_22_704789_g303_i022103460
MSFPQTDLVILNGLERRQLVEPWRKEDIGGPVVFWPGQFIEGRAIVTLKKAMRVDGLYACLEGISCSAAMVPYTVQEKVGDRWESRTKYKRVMANDRVAYEQLTILPPSGYMECQQLDLPFQLKIPTSFRGIPLPPTIVRQDASVTYTLSISFNPDRWFHTGMATKEITIITCIPYLMPSLPVVHPFPFTDWSSRKLRVEQHTWKEKLLHVLTRDPSLRTPHLAFYSTVTVPTQISINQPFDLSLDVKQEVINSNDPQETSLELRTVEIDIVEVLNIMVSNTQFSTTSPLGAQKWIIDHKFPLRIDSYTIPIVQNLCLTTIAAKILPGFTTVPFQLNHTLRIKSHFIHSDTKKTFTVSIDVPITVLPPYNPSIQQSLSIPIQPLFSTYNPCFEDQPDFATSTRMNYPTYNVATAHG